MDINECPLCRGSKELKVRYDPVRSMYYVSCYKCKDYDISEQFILFSDYKNKLITIGYVLSAYSRELFEYGRSKPIFLTSKLEETLKDYLIPDLNSVEAKAKKITAQLKHKTEYFGQKIELNKEDDYPLAYAKNSQEFIALLDLLKEKKYLDYITVQLADSSQTITLQLTGLGWEISYELVKPKTNSTQGFIAIWFDPEMNESLESIEEAIIETGFKPLCIRDEHFSEKIMDKALGEIRQSKFIIVDLTGGRHSVYFEAGFAFGLGIDTIYVYRASKDQNSPLDFYVKHYQCYVYENPKQLKENLINAINARIVKT